MPQARRVHCRVSQFFTANSLQLLGPPSRHASQTSRFPLPAMSQHLTNGTTNGTTNGDSAQQAPKNVLGSALQLFSRQPLTGFYRDGYCRAGAADFGNHSVAGVVSEEFLDFTASRGNDLRGVGLRGGCKWCLCASRWLEALEAFRAGQIARNAVPLVQLDATHDAALRTVSVDDLREFATEREP